MTNFIEELEGGDCFLFNQSCFVITNDYKKDNSKLCIDLKTGCSRWIRPDTIVEKISVFHMDAESNIIAIKELSRKDVNAD